MARILTTYSLRPFTMENAKKYFQKFDILTKIYYSHFNAITYAVLLKFSKRTRAMLAKTEFDTFVRSPQISRQNLMHFLKIYWLKLKWTQGYWLLNWKGVEKQVRTKYWISEGKNKLLQSKKQKETQTSIFEISPFVF